MPSSGGGTGVPVPAGPPPSGATASSEQWPLTPLEFLREAISYDPYLFWGLSNERVLLGSACNQAIYEYAWQHVDQIGRTEMRRSLLEAENQLQTVLHFSIAPHFVEETQVYLQQNLLTQNFFYNSAQWGAGDSLGRWTSIQLNEGYVRAFGYEDLTLINTVAVAITDENNDTLYDTFTATVATTETDPLKLAIYFASADRLDNEGVSERWRIQPVRIAIAGGVATIVGRVWTIVKPILYQKATAQTPLDPDTLSNFISTVSVYTRTTNPNGTDISNAQAKMVWETLPFPSCCNDATDDSTDPAAEGYAVGRVGVRNAKLGIVTPAQGTYNADTQLWSGATSCWNWRPDRVLVRYNAGYPLDVDGQVNKKLRNAVTDLAIASMPERACACDVANKVLHHLQWDLARTANGVEQYGTTFQQLNNIFGTRRGQVQAWRNVKRFVLHRGVTI